MTWADRERLTGRSYDQMTIAQRGLIWPAAETVDDIKARLESPEYIAMRDRAMGTAERFDYPKWMPPKFPQYNIHSDGTAFSCMSKDLWDGGSPDEGDQIFFRANFRRTWLMDIGDYALFEFASQNCPYKPDGSLKPTLVIAS